MANCSLNTSAPLPQFQSHNDLAAVEGDNAGSGRINRRSSALGQQCTGRDKRSVSFKRHFPSDWQMLSVFIPVYQGRENEMQPYSAEF